MAPALAYPFVPRHDPIASHPRTPALPGSVPPHLVRHLDAAAELRPLLFLGEQVAFLGRGEAALRREAELVEVDELRGFVEAAHELVLALERAGLRRHDAEHGELVLRQQPQWLEA